MTAEGKVKLKIKKILNDINAYYCMPATAGYGNSGIPDFLVCYRGKFIGIEAKAEGNKPTALQYKHLKEIQDNGGMSLVVNEENVLQLHELLRSIDDGL
jgi:hypothetical protein